MNVTDFTISDINKFVKFNLEKQVKKEYYKVRVSLQKF